MKRANERSPSAAALISAEAYEKSERELEILKRIVRGEKEVRSRKGHDLDDVMADADKLLAQ